MNSVLRFVFIAAFLFIYLVAVILLKPTRFHVKRKYSTMSLKISYLLYLAIFLIFSYLFMFFNNIGIRYFEDPDNPKTLAHFIILLLAFLIPNIGILIRRKIKKRTGYNVIMSFVNLVLGTYLWFLIEHAI